MGVTRHLPPKWTRWSVHNSPSKNLTRRWQRLIAATGSSRGDDLNNGIRIIFCGKIRLIQRQMGAASTNEWEDSWIRVALWRLYCCLHILHAPIPFENRRIHYGLLPSWLPTTNGFEFSFISPTSSSAELTGQKSFEFLWFFASRSLDGVFRKSVLCRIIYLAAPPANVFVEFKTFCCHLLV